jgi:hypothetical protein
MSISKYRARPPWLLFVFSLPGGRASQRVEVWRKLQRYGAIPLGNSGYLLPNNPATQERFEWLAAAIRNFKGEASVVQVQEVDNLPSPELTNRFLEARSRDYQTLIHELQKRLSSSAQKRVAPRLSRLRSRFQEIVAVDFFHSPLKQRVEELLERAEKPRSRGAEDLEVPKAKRSEYTRRVWVTRPRPGIDRSASAWLIRRFIDSKGKFQFAREGKTPRGAIPFDMYQGGFGHRGEDCTFETLTKVFRISNRKVTAIGQIIHDADLGDEKFGRREGVGIDAILTGWAKQGVPDKELLERGVQAIEGLYRSLV